uniref:Trichoplein keratin filament-binding protein n=2 Tax=Melopsittacus undulatus TaxID=13146 RepID=A0A8V5GQ00_MELUD
PPAPTLPGQGYTGRWAAGREREARSRQQWERTSRNFAQAAVCCSLQARWSQPRALRDAEEAAARLEQRRARLRRLLGEEREALAAELRRGRGAERSGERQRSEELRAGSEERRGKVSGAPAAPGGSGTRRGTYTPCTYTVYNTRREATELEEKRRYENKYETARREALERMRQEEEKRRQEGKKQAEMLLQQIEELKLQEREATKLKKEQENLLKQQWELESLEEERKQMEEHRKKRELGRYLCWHQCNAQLQRRAQQIQEELEIDRQILSALLEKEDEEQRRQSVRRERAVADAAWMKRVIEEQLQLEKEREAELQTIFREEARKMWEKREEEWQREKAARDRLMNEVLAGRQRQIQEKMELNRRAQEESIRYREQLIKDLEKAKELTRQEKEQEEELKRARRLELEAQVLCRLQEQEEQQHQREEEEEERSAQQHCQELVQQEAKGTVEQGYRPRVGSRAVGQP